MNIYEIPSLCAVSTNYICSFSVHGAQLVQNYNQQLYVKINELININVVMSILFLIMDSMDLGVSLCDNLNVLLSHYMLMAM